VLNRKPFQFCGKGVDSTVYRRCTGGTDLKPGKRVLSKDARRRMAAAGAQNLAQWHSRAHTRVQEIQAQVDTFRAGLLQDAGASMTTTKAGLIEAAVLSFTCILKLRHSVINGRKSDVADLGEKSSWSCSSLLTCLKTLDLDRRPKPRTLQEVFAMKAEEESRNQGANRPVSKESGQKGIESGGKPA
jgi:hypothetical protein